MALTKAITRRKQGLEGVSFLFYGPPKVGKSTLANHYPKALFLETEPGLKHLDVYKEVIMDWDDFVDKVKDIIKGNHGYETIIIDTVDMLGEKCMAHVCERENMAHPSDEGYGKGWSMCYDEFTQHVSRLCLTDYTIIFISHSKDIPYKTRTMEITKTQPTFSTTVRRCIMPIVDVIAYFGFDLDGERELVCVPSESLEAGDRTSKLIDAGGRFKLQDSATKVYKLIKSVMEGKSIAGLTRKEEAKTTSGKGGKKKVVKKKR